MKDIQTSIRSIYRLFAVLIALALIGVIIYMIYAMGLFGRKPVMEIMANNCYQDTITFAADDEYWPYTFFDENGQFIGYDIETANAVANKIHVNIRVLPMPWEEALKKATEREVDGVLTCEYGDAEATDCNLMMTTPYESGEFVVFGKKKVTKAHQLAGHKIGLMLNGNVNHFVYAQGLKPWCKEYESNKAAMIALAHDECDYMLVRYIVGLGILKEMGDDAKGIKPLISFSQSNLCIGINDQDTALAEKVSAAVLELKKEGVIDHLTEKWLTTFVEPHSLIETFILLSLIHI